MDLSNQEQEQESDIMLISYALGERNPGAHTVVAKMFGLIEQDESKNQEIMDFITKLLNNNIVGARLWYIFKNEAKTDINNLIKLDLSQFTNEYFYDKFEKYIS
jgi:prolipoprotein diacylglyceryltransferase